MPRKKTQDISDNNQEIQKVIDQQASKEMGMIVVDGKIVEKEKEVEKEIEKKKPIEDEETIVDFDPDKFAEQAAEKVTQRLAEEEKRKIDEQKVAEQKEKMEDEMVPIFEREGRNPTDYNEIVRESNRIAELKFTKILEQREETARLKAEEDAKAREASLAKSKQFEEDFNKMLDEELTELYQNGKLPKIVDENNPDDVGKKAKFELFKTMKEVNDKRVQSGQLPITSISRIFNNYYKGPSSQPAGADAPISAGRGVVTEEKEEVMPYAKLHKTSFLDMFRVKK